MNPVHTQQILINDNLKDFMAFSSGLTMMADHKVWRDVLSLLQGFHQCSYSWKINRFYNILFTIKIVTRNGKAEKWTQLEESVILPEWLTVLYAKLVKEAFQLEIVHKTLTERRYSGPLQNYFTTCSFPFHVTVLFKIMFLFYGII